MRGDARACRLLTALATIVGASVVLASPALAAATITIPSSIDATGRTDVTTRLNSFFSTVPNGATVVAPRGARYNVEGTVTVAGRRSVTIEGNGATLVARTDGQNADPFVGPVRRNGTRRKRPLRLRTHLLISASSNVTVRDLTVVGPNSSGRYRPALEGQAGVSIAGSRGVVLDNVATRDTNGDGFYVSGRSREIAIRRCSVEHAGRQGVAIVGASGVVIDGCTFKSVARSIVDLEPNSRNGQAANVRIRNNKLGAYNNFVLAGVGAGPGVHDVWLQDNVATGDRGITVYVGVPGRERSGFHVIGNRGSEPDAGYQGALMRFVHINGVEVRNNEQPVAEGSTAVLLVGSCNAKVEGNDFEGASDVQRSEGSCGSLPATPSSSPRGPKKRKAASRVASSGDGSGIDVSTALIGLGVGVLVGGGAVAIVMRRRSARSPG